MGGARILLNSGWLVPALLVALAAIWWRGRRAGDPTAVLLLRSVFAAWVAGLVAVTLFPLPLPPYSAVDVVPDPRGWPAPYASFVPFSTIGSAFGEAWDLGAGRYLAGNITAFVPLGLLAPMLSDRWRSWRRALLIGLGVSALIEATQFGLSLGMGFPWRVADVDDLLLNTVGTLVGYGIRCAGHARRTASLP